MPELTKAERLVALRDRLELLLKDADAARTPALAKEYRAVLAELEKVPNKEASTVDDLAARRRARIAETTGSDKAAAPERGVGSGSD